MGLLLLCIKIFIARALDVSLASFVTVSIVKNKRLIATIIGFIDVLIWFIVVKEALNTELNQYFIALSYAGGYALGTFIGTTLSNKLIKGNILVQVILDKSYENKIETIRDAGFAISEVDCKGKDKKPKLLLLIEMDKKRLNDFKSIMSIIDKNAFTIVNDTKFVENGFFR